MAEPDVVEIDWRVWFDGTRIFYTETHYTADDIVPKHGRWDTRRTPASHRSGSAARKSHNTTHGIGPLIVFRALRRDH